MCTLFLKFANIRKFLRTMCQARVCQVLGGVTECFVHAGSCYENIWEILNLNDPTGWCVLTLVLQGWAWCMWGGGTGSPAWQVRSTQLTLTVSIYLLSDFPISCSDNESTSNYIASNLHILFLIVQLSWNHINNHPQWVYYQPLDCQEIEFTKNAPRHKTW